MSKAKVLAAWFVTGILCFTAFFMFRKNGAEVKVYGSSMAPTIDSGQKFLSIIIKNQAVGRRRL